MEIKQEDIDKNSLLQFAIGFNDLCNMMTDVTRTVYEIVSSIDNASLTCTIMERE